MLSTLVTVSDGKTGGCEDINVASTLLLNDTNVGAMLPLDATPTELVEDLGVSEVTTALLTWVVMVTGCVSVTVGNSDCMLVMLPMSSVTFGVVAGIML